MRIEITLEEVKDWVGAFLTPRCRGVDGYPRALFEKNILHVTAEGVRR